MAYGPAAAAGSAIVRRKTRTSNRARIFSAVSWKWLLSKSSAGKGSCVPLYPYNCRPTNPVELCAKEKSSPNQRTSRQMPVKICFVSGEREACSWLCLPGIRSSQRFLLPENGYKAQKGCCRFGSIPFVAPCSMSTRRYKDGFYIFKKLTGFPPPFEALGYGPPPGWRPQTAQRRKQKAGGGRCWKASRPNSQRERRGRS